MPTATYATTNGNGMFGYTQGSTKNAYLDATAKSIGYAYLNGIVGHYNGTFWQPINDSNKVLSGDFITAVNIGDIEAVSGNGLIYTGTSAPFNLAYSPQSQFGATPWVVAECNSINPSGNITNICESKGMLLPTYSETQINVTSIYNPCGGTGNMGGTGVPSHPLGYTWTSTASSDSSTNYRVWSGMSGSNVTYGNTRYIRCVR